MSIFHHGGGAQTIEEGPAKRLATEVQCGRRLCLPGEQVLQVRLWRVAEFIVAQTQDSGAVAVHKQAFGLSR